MALAVAPGGVQVDLEPGWGGHREPVPHVAHGCPDEFEPVEGPDRGENVGGIGAVRASGLQAVVGLKLLQPRLEEQVLRPAVDEARAALTEHRRIKPRIGAFQGQRIFPVDPPTDGLGGLPVGQAFGTLEDQHSC